MTGNGNNPNVTIATPPMNRARASGPILILAMLFVIASFLTWYFTWFGRELSDTEIMQRQAKAGRVNWTMAELLIRLRLAASRIPIRDLSDHAPINYTSGVLGIRA